MIVIVLFDARQRSEASEMGWRQSLAAAVPEELPDFGGLAGFARCLERLSFRLIGLPILRIDLARSMELARGVLEFPQFHPAGAEIKMSAHVVWIQPHGFSEVSCSSGVIVNGKINCTE